MNDRELLELAAKAAGLLLEHPDDEDGVFIAREKYRNGYVWNPLTDDGDALRLAVKLELDLLIYEDGAEVLSKTTSPILENEILLMSASLAGGIAIVGVFLFFVWLTTAL
jgi:hypothetical protein